MKSLNVKINVPDEISDLVTEAIGMFNIKEEDTFKADFDLFAKTILKDLANFIEIKETDEKPEDNI